MKKDLSWKEALKRSARRLLFLSLMGAWLVYLFVSSGSWVIGLIFGVTLVYFLVSDVRSVKQRGIVVCPQCERELSASEKEYKFSLCCKKEIKID